MHDKKSYCEKENMRIYKKSITKSLCRQIRSKRIEMGVTQEKFSKIMGIKRSRLANIETEGCGISFDILVKMNAILGISIDDAIKANVRE